MSEFAILTTKISAASTNIRQLEPGRGGTEEKRKLLRSLYSEIIEARTRGVSFEKLAEAITKSTEIRVSAIFLSNFLKQMKGDEERKTKEMSRKIAEQHAKNRLAVTPP